MNIENIFLILHTNFSYSFFSIAFLFLGINNQILAKDNFDLCQENINNHEYKIAAVFCAKVYKKENQTFNCLKGYLKQDEIYYGDYGACLGEVLRFKSKRDSPNRPTADEFHFLGNLYQQLGKFSEARTWYTKANDFWVEGSEVNCDSDSNCFHKTIDNKEQLANVWIKISKKKGISLLQLPYAKKPLSEFADLKDDDKNAQYNASKVFGKGSRNNCKYLSRAAKLGHEDAWWTLREYDCIDNF